MPKLTLLSALPLFALASCATTTAAVVSNSVTSAETALTAADKLALIYTSLPACGSAGATAACSVPAIKAEIKANAEKAYEAVKQAEAGTVPLSVALAAVNTLTASVPATAAK